MMLQYRHSMTYQFRVRRHPLGVVVSREGSTHGELLIAGEECCGVPVEELERIADSSGVVQVADAASCNCPYMDAPGLPSFQWVMV